MTSIQLKNYLSEYSGYVNTLKQNLYVGEIISLEYNFPNAHILFYKGLIIAKQGKYFAKNITLRYTIDNITADHIFPVYSPNILNIIKKQKLKVRRSKLFYFRNLKENFHGILHPAGFEPAMFK